MKSARDEILGRVRAALGSTEAPPPHDSDRAAAARALLASRDPGRGADVGQAPSPATADRVAAARAVLPLVPDDPSAWPAWFGGRLEALSGRYYRVVDVEEAAGVVARLEREGHWRSVLVQNDLLVAAVTAELTSERVFPGSGAPELAACDAGVTTCRALVAQTGSILVTAADAGRAGTVLPPHHIVLATTEQVVPDLPAAWALMQDGGRVPSFVSLVTGPSRTADIERTLVLGAHGPIRLTVILIG